MTLIYLISVILIIVIPCESIKVHHLMDHFRELSTKEAMQLFLYRNYTKDNGMLNRSASNAFYSSLTCFDMIRLAYGLIYSYEPTNCTNILSLHNNTIFLSLCDDLSLQMNNLYIYLKQRNIKIFQKENVNLEIYCSSQIKHMARTFWLFGIISRTRLMAQRYFLAAKFLDNIAIYFM